MRHFTLCSLEKASKEKKRVDIVRRTEICYTVKVYTQKVI